MGQQKEWTDDQIVAAGEFVSPVAKQDPNISTQEFMVKMDKIHSIDTEKNRHFMADDFDSGKKYSGVVQNL